MNTPHNPQQALLRGTELRTALGPGFQLAGATERLLREAARKS